MSEQDVEVSEFVGWVAITAKLYGWAVIRSATCGVGGALDPDLICFGADRVVAFKVKTRKAANASGAKANGGLTDNQQKVRLGIEAGGSEYHVLTPEDAQDALSVLAGDSTTNGTRTGGRSFLGRSAGAVA